MEEIGPVIWSEGVAITSRVESGMVALRRPRSGLGCYDRYVPRTRCT